MAKTTRHWCARIQYPGKEPVLAGSVTVDAAAKQHETEKAVKEAIDKHLPEGWALIGLVPGCIIFVPEDE